MKFRIMFLVGFGLIAAGCAEKAPPAAEEAAPIDDAAAVEEAVTEEAAAAVDAATDALDVTAEQVEEWRDAGFLDHMHMHAEQLDELNFALADGDLDGAMTPAYWLSRHKTVRGLPEELTPYLDGMRQAAKAVEAAEDLETARAAAQEIGVHCVACHTAAGVVVKN